MTLVVGFDLDLTLVDSRPGVRAVLAVLSEELGTTIDADLVASRLGPSIEEELAHWFPTERIPEAAGCYRRLSADFGARMVEAMPGAAQALEAVRRSGGRVVVVTAKMVDLARINLATLGLEVDALHGWLWGAGKAEALLAEGAGIYVGDHPLDVIGARAAGALSVGVRTGGSEPLEADVLLDDLRSFPAWLEQHLHEARSA